MSFENPPREIIRALLETPKTFAVVGCSRDRSRDSHRIATLLLSRGHQVVPINPASRELLGRRCYPSLTAAAADHSIDVADIFRKSQRAGAHVDEAITLGLPAVWLQLGVIDEAAAQRALEAGLTVVMDRCPAIEYRRLL